MSRPGLLLVVVLFCLPLFAGLRTFDLETDESIYSHAVDQILVAGGWLEPKAFPSETTVFLEKPPLKFWIVAAPIRFGVLPWNEVGLRFWDALFGGIGFLYVFSIGCLIAGPLCGFVGVLLLFVHDPLIVDHGLLSNNMEASLFLCYSGGVFHFLKWASAQAPRGPGHAYAVGLFFVLGFMTKFVAAIFLPAILGGTALASPSARAKLLAEWRLWVGVAVVVLALVAPWFIYAQMRFGNDLWDVLLRQHVYTRFTSALNPVHIQPPGFYVVTLWRRLSESGAAWLVAIGVLVLCVRLVRRRSIEEVVLALWIAPLVVISGGSSKLYHYVYPFLPPLTLAAGCFAALTFDLLPPWIRQVSDAIEDYAARTIPGIRALASRPAARTVGTAAIWIAAALAFGTLLVGTLNVKLGGITLLKNSNFVRPIMAILIVALAVRKTASVASLVVLLMLASWMPATQYRHMLLTRLVEPQHPMRDARDCVQRIQAEQPQRLPGLYIDAASQSGMLPQVHYTFRRVQPWIRQETASPAELDRVLHDPGAQRPSLVWEQRYREYLAGPDRLPFTADPPGMVNLLEYVLLLPEPYAACGHRPQAGIAQ